MLKRTYLLSGIAVLTALGLMACGSSGSGQTEAKGSVSGNSETEAAANEESLNFTMALVDNSQSNYYKGAEKIAELVNEATDHPGRRRSGWRGRYPGYGDPGRSGHRYLR